MMALLRFCNLSRHLVSDCNGISRVITLPLFFSTETTNILQQSQISQNEDSLWKRISPVGNPKASIIPIIDQWTREGNDLRFDQFVLLIKQLRKFNRYTQALELSEWMAKTKRMRELSPSSVAVRVDLLSRVKGLEQAEKYFNGIPDRVKNFKVYGALLCCYAHKKSVKKAEDMAEKMRQMGMMTTLSYNIMLNLYKEVGDHEKLDKVYQEMLEMLVPCNKPTHYIRLNAYASALDVEGMERLLKQMEDKYDLGVKWNAYVIASNGYIKSGLEEKAFEMLQKSEKCIHGNSSGAAWEILISMYSVLGKKEDVYRIWDLYKGSRTKVYNRGYASIIGALVRLDDIDGAEKLLAEWESANLAFDFKIPNTVIKAYCTKGLLEKAEAYVGRVTDLGKQPPARTWSLLASAYTRENQMEKAVEMLKKCAVAEDKHGCKLDQDTLRECMEHLNAKGDLELAEYVKRTVQERFSISEASTRAVSLKDGISEGHRPDEMEEFSVI